MKSILILCLCLGVAQAQIIDRTTNKAKNKTNNRVDNKIDRGLDKGLDGIEGLFKKKKTDEGATEPSEAEENTNVPGSTANSGTPGFSFGSKADVADKYSFNHSIAYHYKTTKKNGKVDSEADMTMLLSDDKPLFGMETSSEGADATMVYDLEKNQMVNLTKSGDTNMGIVIGIDPATVAEYSEKQEAESSSTQNIKKSGRTKSILGYNCEEWISEDDKQKSEVWISTDLNINIGKAFSAMASSAKGKGPIANQEYPSGTMLEMTSVDKKSGEVNHMVATKIEPNSNPSVSTVGYQFMTIPGQ